MSSPPADATSNEPVIRCKSVYMIFGDNAKAKLDQANGVVDADVDLDGVPDACEILWGMNTGSRTRSTHL